MAKGAHYDASETRAPAQRERAALRQLRALLKIARAKAPALRKQLAGVAIDGLKDSAALAKIPLLRKSELAELQRDGGPFGGLTPARAGALKHLLVSPGPIFEPEAHGKDWWGAARALHAAIRMEAKKPVQMARFDAE